MGAEVVLFIIVAVVAIAAAAAMLASENAVHSALFLIVNFICVAFLYLLLEAPFLAMVQIAVYAGAIMVLFLFVIMLLGAEKLPPGEQTRQFRWLAPLGLTLASAFLIAAAWGLSEGRIDAQQPPPGQAFVRFAHVAAEAVQIPSGEGVNPALVALARREFDVYVNGELVEQNITFGENTTYSAYDPGDLAVVFSPTGTQVPFITGNISIAPDSIVTVVLYGADDASLALAPVVTEPVAVERNTGRIVLFNALPQPVGVVNVTSELSSDGRQVTTVIPEIASGTATSTLDYLSGTPNWIVIEAGTENVIQAGDTRTTLVRLSDQLNVRAQQAQVVLLAGQRAIDGGTNPLRPVVFALPEQTPYAFGSPQSVGFTLFTAYVLPLQLVALLLLAAMVGVIVLTLHSEHEPKPSRALRRRVSRPLTSVIASQTGSDLTSGAPQLESPREADKTPELTGD